MRQPKPRRKCVVRYHLPDGTRCKSSDPGAVRTKTRTDAYYALLPDPETGKPVSVPLGTTDEGQAWQELRRLQRDRADRRAGIRDRYTDQAERPLDAHLADWLQAVRDSGQTAGWVDLIGRRVRKLAALAQWQRLGDLTGATAQAALARLQREKGRGARTRNHYLAHVKQLAHWLLAERRIREDPFLTLGPVPVESDRRHERRCPADEEVEALFRHLATGETTTDRRRWTVPKDGTAPIRKRMTGPQRALGYKVCMATGFRAGELRSLRRESFDLDAGTVVVRAGYSKRRRTDTQQLPAWLVAELREWFEAGGGCWERFPANFPGRVLQADLELSGVPYAVPGPDGPTYFDFHSLRVWYCTQLANQGGISPKTLMTLCRHSTPSLTLSVYAKARLADQQQAVEALPEPGRKSAEKTEGKKKTL
jgi:integrase